MNKSFITWQVSRLISSPSVIKSVWYIFRPFNLFFQSIIFCMWDLWMVPIEPSVIMPGAVTNSEIMMAVSWKSIMKP